MQRKNWQILAVMIALILVTLLLATTCAKPAPAPAPTPAPIPAPVPTPTPVPAPTKPIELKLSHPFPPTSLLPLEVLGPWAKEVEELTNGRVRVTIYGGGSLGPMTEQYNLVLTGTADIASFAPDNILGVFPKAEVMTLPLFCWKFNEASSVAYWELMKKYMMDTEFKDVKVLRVLTTGPQQIFTKSKPVKTLEDFKGMKFGSISRMQTEIFKTIGAAPVFMLPADLYVALDRGMIDGVLFTWDGSIAFKMPEVTKYRTANLDMGTGNMVQVMNRDVWNSLPQDIQKIIDEKGLEWSRGAGAMWDRAESPDIQMIEEYDKKAGNPPIYYLPESEKARWKEAVQPLIDAWAAEKEAKGIPAKAMVADLITLIEQYSK